MFTQTLTMKPRNLKTGRLQSCYERTMNAIGSRIDIQIEVDNNDMLEVLDNMDA
jgi:hypothetical protein